MPQYKTGYAAALKRNKLTYDELYKNTKEAYDHVVSVQAQVKELYDELEDLKGDERTSANQSISNVERELAIIDTALIKKIDGHNAAVARTQAMQVGRAEAKAAKDKAKAEKGAVIEEPVITDEPEVAAPVVVQDAIVVEEPVIAVTETHDPAPVVIEETITYTYSWNESTSLFDVINSKGEIVSSFTTEDEATKEISKLSKKKKSNVLKWILGSVVLAGLAIGTGVIITNSQASSIKKPKWF